MQRKAAHITRLMLYAFLVLGLSTCEDPFRPDLSDIEVESELVVEGFVTDADEPHRIRLTRTLAVNAIDSNIPKELGATVQIVDQNSNVHVLTEGERGEYFTNPAEFRAQIGNAYQLQIELANGQRYESDFQELLPVTPIDSLWYARDTKEEVIGTFVRNAEVVNIFTNYEQHDEPAYYRYEYFGTYRFTSELQGQDVCWANPADVPDDLVATTVCYVDDFGNQPLNVSTYPDPVSGTTGFAEILSTGFDIRFREGFSVQVKKFAITKEYHDFLSAVREQSEFGGSIFDPPPTQIIGNIRSVDDPDQFALGYFSTLAETRKRIFIPPLGAMRLEGRCDIDPNNPIPPARDCCDCRARRGSSDVQPDFWLD